jgi:hypothetical protein
MERVDGKIILEGVLQQFDRSNRNGGRIYPIEEYEKILKRIVPNKRMKKIISLKKSWK